LREKTDTHNQEMCIFRERVEAHLANSRDRTNRSRRRYHSTSSLSSNESDHDILRANSRSQPVPIPAPRTPTPRIPTPAPRTLTPIVRVPTPAPRTLTPIAQIHTPLPETQMISYQTNQAPSSIRPRSPSKNFDKRKTYFSLRNQILKLEQGTDESMNTYIARAQELLSDCIECLMASNVSNKESAIQTLNDDITNGFVHGTLEKYLKLFTTKNFPDFTTACTEARRAEEELAEFPQLNYSAAIKRD
ncbi:hypothetical protein PV325_014088, partial [Microctonus aethiopoides]